MKIYLSVDMEGVAGIVHDHQCDPAHPEYASARQLMIAEANAAIAGAFDAGATEVYVNDAHYTMRNLDPAALDSRAILVSGTFKAQSMMAGLDDSFAAAVYVGYHAKAHSPAAVLAHTHVYQVDDVRINGISVGEYGSNALVAGAYNVPIACVTGDAVACEQVRALLGDTVERVVVKRALSTIAATSVHPEVATARIRAGVSAGIVRRAQSQPFKPQPPIRLEVDWATVLHADLCAQIPGSERLAARTVGYRHEDPLVIFRTLFAMIELSEAYPLHTPLPRFG
jgi:D-amino peptidase